jgi:hypothetical protein
MFIVVKMLWVFVLLWPALAATETTSARWMRELREGREMLLAERDEEAYEISRKLIDELETALKGGQDSNDLVATALFQLALAEAGLGWSEPADWHLELAEIFNSAFRGLPLAEFGTAGVFLEEGRQRRFADEPTENEILDLTPLPGLVPPEILESPHVVFRASLEVLQALDPDLQVVFVIDRDGRVRQPVVNGRLDNPAPVLLSLEVLRDWSFTPSRFDAEPVPVHLSLDLPLTQGAVRRARYDLRLLGIACLLAAEDWPAAQDAADQLLEELATAPLTRGRNAAWDRAQELLAEAVKGQRR